MISTVIRTCHSLNESECEFLENMLELGYIGLVEYEELYRIFVEG